MDGVGVVRKSKDQGAYHPDQRRAHASRRRTDGTTEDGMGDATGKVVLALDTGTTSGRALVIDSAGIVLASAQQEAGLSTPRPGWVEQDAEALWQAQLSTARTALEKAEKQAADVAGIGIANQRETTIIWDRATSRPVAPAIVWQDRRTAAACEQLRGAGAEALVRRKTGLLIDPYFSATKIRWLLDNVPGVRERAATGELAFGTVDSWMAWRLSGGRRHVTDATNASRTLLYDIREGAWDGHARGHRLPGRRPVRRRGGGRRRLSRSRARGRRSSRQRPVAAVPGGLARRAGHACRPARGDRVRSGLAGRSGDRRLGE
jgi:hypothetical protein